MAELTSINGFQKFGGRKKKNEQVEGNDPAYAHDDEQDLPPIPQILLDISPAAANPWEKKQTPKKKQPVPMDWIVDGEAWLREFVSEQFEDLSPVPHNPKTLSDLPFQEEEDIPALRSRTVVQGFFVNQSFNPPADDPSALLRVENAQYAIRESLLKIENEQAGQSKQIKRWPYYLLLAVVPLIYFAVTNAFTVSNLQNELAVSNAQAQSDTAVEEIVAPVEVEPVVSDASQSPVTLPEEVSSPSLVIQNSVLTETQEQALYEASMNYTASSQAEAVEIAQSIGYVKNDGHPSNMCGPLSIAILKDAGLIDPYVEIGDFWLLNPRDEYTIENTLEKYFPREDYLWYQTTTSVRYFDFDKFPLKAGDFIYLFAGPRDTFEHMITVSRVDEQGRVYTVSAKQDDSGFTIDEFMLYDPQQPGEGYFYDLTDRENMIYGNTGSGGFWLWRPLSPIQVMSSAQQQLMLNLDKAFEETGGEWHVMVKEVGGEVVYSRQVIQTIHPASVIKVPIAIQFFKALDYQDQDNLWEYLETKGTENRTYLQLLSAMLVDSEEYATDILENWIVKRQRPDEVFGEMGVLNTEFEPRRTTVEDMALIFEGLYQGKWLTEEERSIILELLIQYTPNDEFRLGVLRPYMTGNDRIINKRGSETNWGIIVADSAIIEVDDTAYVVSIFGYNEKGGSSFPTYSQLENTIENFSFVLWDYLVGFNYPILDN